MAVSSVRAWKADTTPGAKSARVLACFLPVLVLLAGNALLCLVNWRVYGLPIRNDRGSGNYALAMRDLYLIEPDPADEARLSSSACAGHYHNIYYSTLCKAYEASPTLASARPSIDAAIDAWPSGPPVRHGRDLDGDHVLFAIRRGVAWSGWYQSLPDSEFFFGSVHRELTEAFADGRLSRRGFSMTAMAAPFRMEHVPGLFRKWRDALLFVARFDGSATGMIGADEPGTASRSHWSAFEAVTGERIVETRSVPAVQPAVDRANALAGAFRACFPGAFLLALIGYVVQTVALIRRKGPLAELSDWWLLCTGVLAGFLVHTACLAYVSATTFDAITSGYLAGSFQLVLMFVVLEAGIWVRAAGWSEKPGRETDGNGMPSVVSRSVPPRRRSRLP